MIVRELKPDLAQAIPPGGSALTGADAQPPLWRRAVSQRTRDLAWCSLSPPLLAHLPDDYSTDAARLAQWPAGVRAAWQTWLAQADPATLPETIAELSAHAGAAGAPASRSLRLGRHAERLLHFALRHAPGMDLLAANVPIRRANGHGVQTLGELDVIWRDPASAETVHWEMAAKFYVMVDGVAGRRAFVGPNLVDRLGDKLDHIVRRQLPLGLTAEAQAIVGHPVNRSEVYLLGWLFYRDGVLPTGLDALGIASDHQHGWWSTLDSWSARATEQARHGIRWCRLQRVDWLSGACVPGAATETAASLSQALAERFADPDQPWRREAPVMICELEPPGVGQPDVWTERSRGFVVPPGWETRALARATQP